MESPRSVSVNSDGVSIAVVPVAVTADAVAPACSVATAGAVVGAGRRSVWSAAVDVDPDAVAGRAGGSPVDTGDEIGDVSGAVDGADPHPVVNAAAASPAISARTGGELRCAPVRRADDR